MQSAMVPKENESDLETKQKVGAKENKTTTGKEYKIYEGELSASL